MNAVTYSTKLSHNSKKKSPALLIIEPALLIRSYIVAILTNELAGLFEHIEIATTHQLHCAAARDVRLIILSIGDTPIIESSVKGDITRIAQVFPHAPIALFSNRHDEATLLAAIQSGVRGFFPTYIPVEVVIAGLALVLAGGVYNPLPHCDSLKKTSDTGSVEWARIRGSENVVSHKITPTLTPREKQVFSALMHGLPNKMIANRLSISENTVKMHIQRILRKHSARNRTEAVLLSNGLLGSHIRFTGP
jgi:DNA-binding NarL/FixJ family response regulator